MPCITASVWECVLVRVCICWPSQHCGGRPWRCLSSPDQVLIHQLQKEAGVMTWWSSLMARKGSPSNLQQAKQQIRVTEDKNNNFAGKTTLSFDEKYLLMHILCWMNEWVSHWINIFMSGCLDSSSIMRLFRHIQGKHFHSAIMTLKKIKYKKGTHLVFTEQRSTLARQLTILKSLSWNMPTFVGTESKCFF